MGRRVAAVFVPRLGVPAGRRWLDVGCGTGALTATVLAAADPTTVIGIDPSAASSAARTWPDGLARRSCPDAIARASCYRRLAGRTQERANWVRLVRCPRLGCRHRPRPGRCRRGGGKSLPVCRPEPLRNLWADAGLADAEVEAIEVPTTCSPTSRLLGAVPRRSGTGSRLRHVAPPRTPGRPAQPAASSPARAARRDDRSHRAGLGRARKASVTYSSALRRTVVSRSAAPSTAAACIRPG